MRKFIVIFILGIIMSFTHYISEDTTPSISSSSTHFYYNGCFNKSYLFYFLIKYFSHLSILFFDLYIFHLPSLSHCCYLVWEKVRYIGVIISMKKIKDVIIYELF